jgi:hypothetical protein
MNQKVAMSLVEKAKYFSLLSFPEAGNQFNSRMWMRIDQNSLINTIERARERNCTFVFEWISEDYLDKQVREARSHFKVYVERLGGTQGIAVVQIVPRIKGKEEIPPEGIISPEERIEWAMNSPYYVLTIPFYELPSWLNPNFGKNLQKDLTKIAKKKVTKPHTTPDKVSPSQIPQPSVSHKVYG